ncbi:spore germination protein [Heyndrickxia sporothermodurans]
MPAILGPFQIGNVTGGVVKFGDSAYISPKQSVKETLGSGSGVTGISYVLNSAFSNNVTSENQVVNQPIAGNK